MTKNTIHVQYSCNTTILLPSKVLSSFVSSLEAKVSKSTPATKFYNHDTSFRHGKNSLLFLDWIQLNRKVLTDGVDVTFQNTHGIGKICYGLCHPYLYSEYFDIRFPVG